MDHSPKLSGRGDTSFKPLLVLKPDSRNVSDIHGIRGLLAG